MALVLANDQWRLVVACRHAWAFCDRLEGRLRMQGPVTDVAP
jgi:hypothetical protein